MNERNNFDTSGKIIRIAGPVVQAANLRDICLNDVVYVGNDRLVGEVIRLTETSATIQVYEDTSGVRVGEPVFPTGQPLAVTLGPGLLGSVYDGLQRPLSELAQVQGNFLQRGISGQPLPLDRVWDFTPTVQAGETVGGGDVLGTTPENVLTENLTAYNSVHLLHRVMVPPGVQGKVVEVRGGQLHATDWVARLQLADGSEIELTMIQNWAVRTPRPIRERLPLKEPLITGTRVIDLLFPVAKGGAAIIPGGFGTGKTVAQHSLSRWSDVDVVVYVGCGERGNEMAEVLEEFPRLEDPHTGGSLMKRTILVANTSNMPVAAREASIYTGITMAEYYRDMGFHVLMLADSTSRWAEALREISSRLEEIPGEEGFPAYMAARLSGFYERAGRVLCLGCGGKETSQPERTGSITIVGAISPPGGDFSEPITQNSMRVAGVYWALDYDLSRRRHFPAINWTMSYSLYDLKSWFAEKVSEQFPVLVAEARALLQTEADLLQIVQLIGQDALSETEREILLAARMLREDLLQQSALDEIDRYCPLEKAYRMLKVILSFHRNACRAVEAGIRAEELAALPVVEEIGRMKEIPFHLAGEHLERLEQKVESAFQSLFPEGVNSA